MWPWSSGPQSTTGSFVLRVYSIHFAFTPFLATEKSVQVPLPPSSLSLSSPGPPLGPPPGHQATVSTLSLEPHRSVFAPLALALTFPPCFLPVAHPCQTTAMPLPSSPLPGSEGQVEAPGLAMANFFLSYCDFPELRQIEREQTAKYELFLV